MSEQSSGGAGETYAALERAFSRLPAMELVCVDLFDTVITRAVGDPAAVHLVLGRRLFERQTIRMSAEQFARARSLAERRARSHVVPPGDVSLHQIYAELGHAHPDLGASTEALVAAEMEVEASLIRPIPGAKQMLAYARGRGGKLAFVSDMYLPVEFLRQRLIEHGLLEEGDLLFVSSSRGCMKAEDGALFKHVLSVTDTRPERAVHIGNSWTDDFLAARKAGMHALFFANANPNRFEQEMENHRWETGGAASFHAGTSRLVRLAHHREDEAERTLTSIAASVAGPFLYGFTVWLLERAKAAGIARLYFLSREGQLMQRVARIVAKRRGIPIETHYLFASRQALNGALLTDGTRDNLEWALTHSDEQDLRRILSRVLLRPEDIATELASCGLGAHRWERPLAGQQRSRLLELLTTGTARALIQERSRDSRALAEGYLRQVGFLDDRRCGAVDSGGLGSQLRTLSCLRKAAGLDPITGFLVFRDADRGLPYGDFPPIHVYLRDSAAGSGPATVRGLWQMLEVFCAADHGAVEGYERHGAEVRPRLAAHRADRVRAWGIDKVQEVVCAFAREAPPAAAEGDVRETICALLHILWSRPLRAEAAVWGRFPWETDATSAERELGFPLDLGDALAILRRRQVEERVWPAAAERRSPYYIRAMLNVRRSVPRYMKGLVRRVLDGSGLGD